MTSAFSASNAGSNSKNATYVLGGGDSEIERQIKIHFDTGSKLFILGRDMLIGDTEEIKLQQLGWKFKRRQELDYELQLATISESYQRTEINSRVRVWRS